MIARRKFLGAGGLASGAGLLGAAGLSGLLPLIGQAADSDYRALVVLFLKGGNDGHNTLVPMDGGLNDYKTARANLIMA